MPSILNKVSQHFAEEPTAKYVCPTCNKGELIPQKSSFSVTEPPFSKNAHSHEAWDPDWIEYRFNYICVCDRAGCGETAHVAGSGSVDQRYDENYDAEYYDSFRIHSFFPVPNIIQVPDDAPLEVDSLLKKCFALFWVDLSAASNAMRASLEALLDELKIPATKLNKKKQNVRLNLHQRLDIWSKHEKEYAELCVALKEVGNLGSHGETVREKHFFGALEIYSHVLSQLYENEAEKMKALAKKIRDEIKGKKEP